MPFDGFDHRHTSPESPGFPASAHGPLTANGFGNPAMRVPFILVAGWLLVLSAGCTHLKLRDSTLLQSHTTTDLQYQQVLTNIAMFERNAEVLPAFSVVGTGGTSVNDQATLGMELEWDPSQLARKMLAAGGTREVEEQWTLAPVVNPDKLRAIRCVFQIVVRGVVTDRECDTLLKDYLGEGYMEWIQRGWYCTGRRCDVPKDACYCAHCGDLYVWVMPEGIDALTRLTVATLNIATLDKTPKKPVPTKTIQKYHYADGRLESVETLTRPDPDGVTAPEGPNRQEFYNPLQSQIQMRRN